MTVGRMIGISGRSVIRSRVNSVIFILILAVYTCAVDISFGSLSILQNQQQALSRLLINLELLVEVAEGENAAKGTNETYLDRLSALPYVAMAYDAADDLSVAGEDRESLHQGR